MEEQLPHKNNWAGRLNDWEGQGSDDDYQPGPGGWARLEAELPPIRRRRRRRWAWWFLLPLFMGIGLGFYLGRQQGIDPVAAESADENTASSVEATTTVAPASTTPAAQTTGPDTVKTMAGTDPVVDAMPSARAEFAPTKAEKAPGGDVASVNQETVRSQVDVIAPTTSYKPLPIANPPSQTAPRSAPPLITRQPDKGDEDSAMEEGVIDNRVVTPLNIAAIPRLNFFVEPADRHWLPPVNPPRMDKLERTATNWSFSAGALLHSQARISGLNTPERSRPLSSDAQAGAGVGIGIHLGLPGRFGLQTGLTVAQQRNEQAFLIARVYRRENEQSDFSTTFPLELNTGYTKVETELTVGRPDGVSLDAPRNIIFRVETEEKIRVRTIPFLLTYDQPLGRSFSLRGEAGLNWHQLKVATSLTARLATANGLRFQRTRLREVTELLSPDYWSWQAGLTLRYQPVNSPWSLALTPTFQQPLNPSLDYLPAGSAAWRLGAWYTF